MTLTDRAEAAQKALFGRYDRLNEKLKLAEGRLTSRHIPHVVGVVYRTQEDDCNNPGLAWDRYCIGLAKIKGEWRLCHGVTDDQDQNWPDWKPLVDCSAEDRVNSAPHLAKLEAKLVEAAEKFVPKVDKALVELDKYLG
jgi:hypothetical protein